MDAVDLDGFLKLHQAGLTEQQTMADVVGKMAANALIWKQVEKADLQNLALSLNIQWDSQAHRSLERVRNQALSKVRAKEIESDKLLHKCRAVGSLLSGGSWTAIQQAWMGLRYVQNISIAVITEASSVSISPEAYLLINWLHPPPLGGLITFASKRIDIESPQTLLLWAATNNYFPVAGKEGHTYLANYMRSLSTAADAEAVKLDLKTKELRERAQKILERDWDRLNVDRSK